MSINPRKLIQGQTVQIHVGLFNKSRLPKFPCLKVQVINPSGIKEVLFDNIICVFPTIYKEESVLERKNPMHNIYLYYKTTEDSFLGSYRVKIEIFNEGILTFQDDLETNFFYLEKISIENFILKERNFFFAIRNHSKEKVLFKIHCINNDSLTSLEQEIGTYKNKQFNLEADIIFIEYANNQILRIPLENILPIRNPRYFRRNEDSETVFILDPKAEMKRSFFLRKNSKYIWEKANGYTPHQSILNDENKELYSQLITKKLIIEI